MAVGTGTAKVRMRITVLLGTLLIAVQAALAAEPPARIPIDSLRTLCSQLFSLERSEDQGRIGFATSVVEPDSNSIFAALVANHELFLGYLLDHSQKTYGPGNNSFLQIEDGDEINRAFQSALERDSSFNEWLLPVLAQWLARQGGHVEGFPKVAADTTAWKWDEVFPLAARFIYVDARDTAGQYQTHVCFEINGLADYSGRKNLWVEAFAFDAIVSDIGSENSSIYPEFQRLGKQVRLAAASKDSTTEVLRAQGAMFGLMAQSPVFQSALKTAYAKKNDVLPVRIVD